MNDPESVLVYRSLRKIRSFPSISACREVPLLGRSVDLVYYQEDYVYTIEFKLRDWRRAIKQARDHLLGADYSYICMPKRTITEEMNNMFRGYGIGLLFYNDENNWPFEEAIEAPRSTETSKVVREWALNYIKGRQKSDKK
jgi:hypothetical protein